MSPRSASGSVKGGQALVTLLLVLAIGFGAVTLASIGVGVARGAIRFSTATVFRSPSSSQRTSSAPSRLVCGRSHRQSSRSR